MLCVKITFLTTNRLQMLHYKDNAIDHYLFDVLHVFHMHELSGIHFTSVSRWQSLTNLSV